MSIKAFAAAAMFCFGFGGAVQAASLVVNGGFEDLGNQSLNGARNGFFSSIPGWTSGPNLPPFEIQTDDLTRAIDAKYGMHYVELDSAENTSIIQDIFLVAGTYELSFYYAPRMNQVIAGTNDLSFGLGPWLQGAIAGAPSPDYPFGEWTSIRTEFKVRTSGSYQLVFAAEGRSNGQGAMLDGISLTAVPIPAAGMLMMAALGGLAATRKGRRKA